MRKLSALVLAACLSAPVVMAGPSQAEPVSCSAVDTLAELYTKPNAFISVDVAGDTRERVCYFSIDGATKEASDQTEEMIESGIRYLSEMREAWRGGIEQAAQVNAASEKFIETLPYILSSARLENGEPPQAILEIVKANAPAISNCFATFYSGMPVNLSATGLSCVTLEQRKDTLLLGVDYQELSYALYTFR